MEYDSRLVKINEQLKYINSDSINAFLTTSKTSFRDLTLSLNSFNDCSKVWDDQVAIKYQNKIKSIIDTISECDNISSNIIIISKQLPKLIQKITRYIQLVDEFNLLEGDYNSISLGKEPLRIEYPTELAYKTKYGLWIKAKKDKDNKKNKLYKKAIDINELLIECYDLINTVNSLLKNDETFMPKLAAIKGYKVDRSINYLPNGNIIKYYHWYDKNNILLRDDYTIFDSSSNLLENGVVDYFENGRKRDFVIVIDGQKQRNTEVYENRNKKEVIRYKTTDRIELDDEVELNIEETYDENGIISIRKVGKSITPSLIKNGIVEKYNSNGESIEISVEETENV